jgi:hypothetical protein
MNINKKIYLFEIFGIVIYTFFIIIAMFTYAGGTWDNPSYPGYDFWGNSFSDLGRFVAYNGSTNLISVIFFSISYIAISVTFIPFYYIFPKLFSERRRAKIVAFSGSIFGVISSICFIGAVFTPADFLRPPHMIFAYIAYVCIFFMGAGYSLALYISKRFPKYITYESIIFSIFFFSMLMLEIIGLNISRVFVVVGQKLGRIAIFIYFLSLTYAVWNLEE